MDLDEHLHAIDQLMWPKLMILGGGVSKNADKFVPLLTARMPIVPAQLRNDAGIIGAAIVAAGAAGAAGPTEAAETGRIIDGPQTPLRPRSSERLP